MGTKAEDDLCLAVPDYVYVLFRVDFCLWYDSLRYNTAHSA